MCVICVHCVRVSDVSVYAYAGWVHNGCMIQSWPSRVGDGLAALATHSPYTRPRCRRRPRSWRRRRWCRAAVGPVGTCLGSSWTRRGTRTRVGHTRCIRTHTCRLVAAQQSKGRPKVSQLQEQLAGTIIRRRHLDVMLKITCKGHMRSRRATGWNSG